MAVSGIKVGQKTWKVDERKVFCPDNGLVWNSVSGASRALGCSPGWVVQCIKSRKRCHNWRVMYLCDVEYCNGHLFRKDDKTEIYLGGALNFDGKIIDKIKEGKNG